jgi:hypothetical protein
VSNTRLGIDFLSKDSRPWGIQSRLRSFSHSIACSPPRTRSLQVRWFFHATRISPVDIINCAMHSSANIAQTIGQGQQVHAKSTHGTQHSSVPVSETIDDLHERRLLSPDPGIYLASWPFIPRSAWPRKVQARHQHKLTECRQHARVMNESGNYLCVGHTSSAWCGDSAHQRSLR